MEILAVIVTIAHYAFSLGLVAIVLLQAGRGGGLSDFMGGGGDLFGGGRTGSQQLRRLTATFSIGFMATSLILGVFASRGLL